MTKGFAASERGGALLTVLAVMIMLTAVAAMILALSGRELSLSVGHRRSLEAFYLAEAGAHLARASLQQFVIEGLTSGLHQDSVENLEELHLWLQGIVTGSSRLGRQCERAQPLSNYTGRTGAGSNSLALFDLTTVGPAHGLSPDRIPTGSPNHAPAQSIRYRYAPQTGIFGFQADGPDDVVTPLGTGGFVVRITLGRDGNAWADRVFPECGGEPRYVFPFRYTIDIEGRAVGARRRLALTGAFSVVVERPSFAQYQWFSNTFGTRAVCQNQQPCRFWLSDETFDGPVHTNDRLWIAGSPVFRARVTSANLRDDDGDGELDPARGDTPGPPVVRFDNAGTACADDAEPGGWCDRDAWQNPPSDLPSFLKGFERGAYAIPLPENADPQEWAALFGDPPQALQVGTPPPQLTNVARRHALGLPLVAHDVPPNVFFPTGTETSRVEACHFRSGGTGGRLLGGIYVGAPLEALRLSVDGDTSVYELYTDPEHRWQVRIDREARRTTVLYERRRTPLTCTYEGVPNGIIVVRGDINAVGGPPRRRPDAGDSAPPGIHRDDVLTVVATGTIQIASDLRYQEDPRGPDGVWSARPCTGDDRCGARNLLALYSVKGDIRLSDTAPNDVVIHAVLMAGQGGIDLSAGRQRQRALSLLGGKINRYEGFMDTSVKGDRIGGGSTLVFQYDHRLGIRLVDPPAFPRLHVIGVRAAPGLNDRPAWVERP